MNTLLRILRTLIGYYLLAVFLLSLAYLVLPPVSTLMIGRLATFQGLSYQPVALRQISPNLIRSVIRAEDSRFCEHYGVDWDSMADTIEEGGLDGPKRGASTIPMQVAKNLFLWPQQSYIRKVIEIPMAMYLNIIWSKPRMMQIYLSVAEWGDGIFGAEAAARYYFRKSARDLTREEAALLAAALPNPKQRNPNHPSGYYAGHTRNILKWANSGVDMTCLRAK